MEEVEKKLRIVKEHDERKNEIIETAARLFAMKGYEQCSVNDILNAIGIAKGTFYHYFKSKEEVLDAVIGQASGLILERVREVVQNADLSPEEKLLQIFLSMNVEDKMEEGLLEEMHRTENALMHQKSLVSIVTMMAPFLTRVVQEGNEKGVFHADFPEQYMQIFLAASSTLLDDGIFEVEREKMQTMFLALISLLEKMLGVESGSLSNKAEGYWQFKQEQ
ncbi:MAG: TetR/AcrR family transcriptional regulator [Clostridiales bacterium]|nr:TetR/AcrR family transcriptional regulator [Clostridiales bacterium]